MVRCSTRCPCCLQLHVYALLMHCLHTALAMLEPRINKTRNGHTLQAGIWVHMAMAAASVCFCVLWPRQLWAVASVYFCMASVFSGVVINPASAPVVVQWLQYVSVFR